MVRAFRNASAHSYSCMEGQHLGDEEIDTNLVDIMEGLCPDLVAQIWESCQRNTKLKSLKTFLKQSGFWMA